MKGGKDNINGYISNTRKKTRKENKKKTYKKTAANGAVLYDSRNACYE